VQTNEKWLSRVLRSPRFLEVRHSIAFLQESGADFAGPTDIDPTFITLAALALQASSVSHDDPAGAANSTSSRPAALRTQNTARSRAPNPWDILDGFTPNLAARVDYTLSWHGHEHNAGIIFTRGKPTAIVVDALAPQSIADSAVFDGVVSACIGNVRTHARYLHDGAHLHLWSGDEHFDVVLDDPRLKEFSTTAAQGGLTTPLPGVVAVVIAKVGQAVKAGDVLMVIEAMKMEHSIRAPHDGVVKGIHFAPGDRVPEGSQLLELAPASAA
jgi:3-methylcrotonyl-CoA carboxylase alpha subunit